jgi:membrane-associated phospholipid phosphatase
MMLRKPCVLVFVITFALIQNRPAFAQDTGEPQKQEQGTQQPPVQDPAQVVRPSETVRTPSTGRRIFTNVWSDQKAMWSSPFHMQPEDRKWWGLFGGATAALIATDRSTSGALPNTASQISLSKNFSRIGADYTTIPVVGGLYLYGRWRNDAKAREAGVLGAETLVDSYVIVGILKLAAGRDRPEEGDGKGTFFKGHHSFPSGHAIMSWSFASLIAHEYAPGKITPIVAYSLASIVSVSRFTARKHFASDIVAGGSIGWFIGKYVFEHHLDPNIHKRYDPNAAAVTSLMPDINPYIVPSTHTYGISLGWTR